MRYKLLTCLLMLYAIFGGLLPIALAPAPPPTTLPLIYKGAGIYLTDHVESTPIVFHGELLTVTFSRENSGSHGTEILVHRVLTRELVARHPFPYSLGSALVVQDRVYVFAVSDWCCTGNHIVLSSTLDLVNWTDPQAIYRASAGQKLLNVSVATADVGFVMAMEISEPGLVDFSIRFANSDDLFHWSTIGGIAHPQNYAAAPTLRYMGGWYYLLYTSRVVESDTAAAGQLYVTSIGRTQDFLSFHWFAGNERWPSPIQVLSPVGAPLEGINNSDVDLSEYGGNTWFVYADGDQQTWAHLRTAIYPGTLRGFFAEYWP